MATISLSGNQIADVIKSELLDRMVDYTTSYESPDADEVLNFYFVWRFYANSQDFEMLAKKYPEVQKVIDEF